jgi:hypothetical protein
MPATPTPPIAIPRKLLIRKSTFLNILWFRLWSKKMLFNLITTKQKDTLIWYKNIF